MENNVTKERFINCGYVHEATEAPHQYRACANPHADFRYLEKIIKNIQDFLFIRK
jgi:hypothetical protein